MIEREKRIDDVENARTSGHSVKLLSSRFQTDKEKYYFAQSTVNL